MTERSWNRRRFLSLVGAVVLTPVVAAVQPARGAASRHGSATGIAPGGTGTHPDPRPDVDGSNVLASDQVAPHARELFDGVREIPQVIDGLGCTCGCAALPDMRSLLSCYEGNGMAQYCDICSGEGRLALRLHAEGRALDEIRAAIDRRFG